MLTWKGNFAKMVLSLQRGLDFSDFGGRTWKQNSTKNQLKHGVQDGMHLGIDFCAMLVDFWSQIGKQSRPKIHPKRHRKNDAKKNGPKFGKMVAALRYPARRGLDVGSTWARRRPERGPGAAGGRVGRGGLERRPAYVI